MHCLISLYLYGWCAQRADTIIDISGINWCKTLAVYLWPWQYLHVVLYAFCCVVCHCVCSDFRHSPDTYSTRANVRRALCWCYATDRTCPVVIIGSKTLEWRAPVNSWTPAFQQPLSQHFTIDVADIWTSQWLGSVASLYMRINCKCIVNRRNRREYNSCD